MRNIFLGVVRSNLRRIKTKWPWREGYTATTVLFRHSWTIIIYIFYFKEARSSSVAWQDICMMTKRVQQAKTILYPDKTIKNRLHFRSEGDNAVFLKPRQGKDRQTVVASSTHKRRIINWEY